MRKILLGLLAALLLSTPSLADWTGKDASNATITFANPGACASVVCTPVAQIYDGTNVITLTTAGATGESNTKNGIPVYSRTQVYNGSTWDRWTGAVTQSGTWNVGQTGAPWSQNVTQFGSSAVVTGTGAGGAGIPRVTISNDSSLAANQSVNVSQINAVTPLMGNGVTGTGSQRVTIASDNTAFSVNATLQATATTAIGKVDPNTLGLWGLVASTQNGTTPTDMMLMAGQFNTTPTTISAGNVSPFQLDNAGNLLVNVKAGGAGGGAVTGGTTSSTALQSGATANSNGTSQTVTGYSTALVNVNCSVACSGGTTINFEGTDSTGTFFALAAVPVSGTSTAVSTATTSGQFWVPTSGLTTIRARISGYSAGTITVTSTPVYGLNALLAQVVNSSGLGQQAMAASSPVVIASNQSALTVGGAGTAGSASGGVLTVQGATSMTAIAANTTQLAGNAISTGNGTQGTGTARVAIASDNSAVAGMGVGATGSAAPANAVYNGTLQSGATGGQLKGLTSCDSTAKYDASTTGSTQIVALAASQTIYVCGYVITTGGTATNVKLVYGTGTNCATGSTDMTPAYQLGANSGAVDRSLFWSGLKTASANALCVNASAANAVQALVYYTQF